MNKSPLHNLHLFVCFTRGVALQTWARSGSIDRELALYRRIREHVAEVTLITYGGSEDEDWANALEFSVIGMHPDARPEEVVTTVRSRVGNTGSSLVKSSQVPGAMAAFHLSRALRAPFACRAGYLPSSFARSQYGTWRRSTIRAVREERRAMRGADVRVVTTPEMKRTVSVLHQVRPSTIRVVPNFVDSEVFTPRCSDPSGFSVLTVGRLHAQKNQANLIRAVAQLGIKLTIVGVGPLESNLRQLAQSLDADVEFLGNVPNADLPKLLHSHSVFALPSLYEGHPKSLIEAMATGTVVLATRSPGVRGLVRDGETGVLCTTSASGIQEGLLELLVDPDRRRSLGDAGREAALAQFSLDEVERLELGWMTEVLK